MNIPEEGVLANSTMFFHTPSSTAKSAFFYLKCAGEFICDENYNIERNTYYSYLIMYVRKGKGTVSFNNRTYQVCENDVVILNCHQPHQYYTKTGWETLWLHFDGNSSSELFELIYNRVGVVVPMGESIAVHRYLSIIVEGFKNGKPLPEALISCHIHRMLVEILLLASCNVEGGIDSINPVIDAVTYIQTNFNRKLTVEEIAGYVKISPFHFSRLFKKEMGYSPYEYIIKTRIDHAKALLKKTQLTVKEISYMVGFNSESNFVNTFHDSVSQTPIDFRNTPV